VILVGLLETTLEETLHSTQRCIKATLCSATVHKRRRHQIRQFFHHFGRDVQHQTEITTTVLVLHQSMHFFAKICVKTILTFIPSDVDL